MRTSRPLFPKLTKETIFHSISTQSMGFVFGSPVGINQETVILPLLSEFPRSRQYVTSREADYSKLSCTLDPQSGEAVILNGTDFCVLMPKGTKVADATLGIRYLMRSALVGFGGKVRIKTEALSPNRIPIRRCFHPQQVGAFTIHRNGVSSFECFDTPSSWSLMSATREFAKPPQNPDDEMDRWVGRDMAVSMAREFLRNRGPFKKCYDHRPPDGGAYLRIFNCQRTKAEIVEIGGAVAHVVAEV